jgi:hypothetical protein
LTPPEESGGRNARKGSEAIRAMRYAEIGGRRLDREASGVALARAGQLLCRARQLVFGQSMPR